MFILDTNVISALRRRRNAPKQLLTWAKETAHDVIYISVITLLELEIGILSMERKDVAQGRLLRTWLERTILPEFNGRILDVDSTIAMQCARLHVPDPRAERDALIAATALVHGMAIVTRNVSDFAGTGVQIVNPWD